MRDTAMQRWDGLSGWLEANSEALLTGTLVALAIVAAMLVLRNVGERITAADPDYRSWKSVIGRVLAKTSLAFMVIAAVAIVTGFAEPPRRVARIVDIVFIIAFAIQGAVWARELILGAIGRRIGEEPGETTLGNAASVIRVLVSIALFAIAFIVILDNVGVNVTALVAGLGIGGIAIGLAAQGIFSDLFAALAILFDKPFKRGDVIRYDNSVGTVERIGLKTTRLRSLTGEQLVMANTKLLEREIHNLADGRSRRSVLTFGLVYQTPVHQLERVPELARAAVEARKGCKFVRCTLSALSPSSLDHELLFEIASLDQDIIAGHRSAVILGLLKVFAAEGIAFAYPTQTTFTAAPDGSLVMPWAPPAAPAKS
ncbi:MAG TPA: mechanosensitive ion channel domain-containing protein [Sphingomicrobium sp.]|nr:mechanosensitive ion channel domain-containing protein [Sphingomicrobium sp.]